jgi:hypothetical protein
VTELAGLLGELEETWRRKGFDQGSRLAPGLSPDEVGSRLDSEGLLAPGEAVDWFSWHDGAREFPHRLGGLVELVPCGFEPRSLAGCLGAEFGRRYYLQFAHSRAYDFRDAGGKVTTPEFWWKRQWLPLMFVGAQAIAVDLGSGSDTVNVHHIVWDSEDYRTPVTKSLADFVRALLSIPDDCWHFSEQDNRWIVNLRAVWLSNSIQPGLYGLLTSGGSIPAG